jgi:ectoine hydroxylase
MLSTRQLEDYARDGFCVVPNCVSTDDLREIHRLLPSIFAEDSPRRVVEKQGGTVRSVYGSHRTHDIFARLVRHPRLLRAAETILGGQVYVYQFKINVKAAFTGDVWDWHQDYIFWREEDGLPTARVANVALFLDDVTEFNGPLYFIPGSHRNDVIDPGTQASAVSGKVQATYGADSPSWLSNLTADLKYALPHDLVAELARRHGLASATGSAGSLLFFDANVVHASPNNVSPFSRKVALVTYNSVHNVPRPVPHPRPEFLASRDATPLTPVEEAGALPPRSAALHGQ